ncbi:MAG: hypothetical protein DLM69_10565 [Candidatus Chloroheliales bacterium]|nr:MAG: hypothetical protein DLM69_10565 [Chloroflexota bacterium]
MTNEGSNVTRARTEVHFTEDELALLDRARGTLDRQPFCRQAAWWVARLKLRQPNFHHGVSIPRRGAWRSEGREVEARFDVVFTDAEQRQLVNQARGELSLSAFVYAASITYARLMIDVATVHGLDI